MPRRPTDDLRRFRRKTVRVLVDYLCDEGVRCDYATTLGAGGLFLETESPLSPGSQVKLRFRLPGSEMLHEMVGRVCWTHDTSGGLARATGIGIQFTSGAAASKLARELEDLDC